MTEPDVAIGSAFVKVGLSLEVRNAGLLAQFFQRRFGL
jgi:hypothetical protein